MPDLFTLRAEAKGAEFSLQGDAFASDGHTLLLASVAGASSQVQSLAAMLQSNVTASITVRENWLAKFDGGYDCHKAKLGYGTCHMLAIARKPGLLLDTSDAALWRELRSERFTTPLLKAWLPVIRKRLVDDELLTEPEQAGCKLGLLDAAPKQLDEIVSEGVKKGSMVIA